MASINPTTATSATISQQLVKLGDSDPDYRFMALNDLLSILTRGRPEILQNDYNTAARTTDYLVRALDDQNGEVQNLAIKCLGALIHRLPSPNVAPLMEKLSTLKLKNSVDTAVQSLALITVIAALPCPTPGEPPSKESVEAYASISRMLIPRLIGRSISSIKSASSKTLRHDLRTEDMVESGNIEMTAEAVDVLIEVVRSFGILLQPIEVEALHDVVVTVLHDSRASSVTKKRAVVAITILTIYLSDEALARFISQTVAVFKNKGVSAATQRLYISILGSMARSIPSRFHEYIGAVSPFILATLDQEKLDKQVEAIEEGNDSSDFNEVREAALVALESFLASCPDEMRTHTTETLQACLRYLKYDPNYVSDDDSDNYMESEDDDDNDFDNDGDDEFEADVGFDDDDDTSWKVRRCAAKAIHTLISTRSSGDLLENGVLYREAAPLLIKRIQEREENVRLEVITALSLLVQKTGEGVTPEFSFCSSDEQATETTRLPNRRKRRRQSSSVSGPSAGISEPDSGGVAFSPTLERTPIPTTGPRAELADKTPSIIAASVKLLKTKQIPSKQAVINLIRDIVTVQKGGISDYFDSIIGLVVEAAKPSSSFTMSASLSTGSGSNASATPATLRIAALYLIGYIANMHPSYTLQPYLSMIVGGVLSVVQDRFYKISAEAVATSEELVKTLTPPRAHMGIANSFKKELTELHDVLMDRATATDVDSEVRQKAIHALGTLLSRTSSAEGSSLVPTHKRTAALEALLSRLQKETSRLAAVRAIDAVAASSSGCTPFSPQWLRQVVGTLSQQLRKSNRSLRGSSIQALRHIVQSPDAKGLLDAVTMAELVSALQPVIADSDALLLSPALHILTMSVQEQPELLVTPALTASICALLQTNVASTVLKPLLQLVTAIGHSGFGQPLMSGLLKDVGIVGDPAVVGKVVGNLLVASGDSAGVTIDSFIKETQTSKSDPVRASLALSVLGEASLRMGAVSPIRPQLFLEQFASDFDKVSVSAAIALGRAGSGNPSQYMPCILQGMAEGSKTQYLLLQSVKEVLQQVAVDKSDISQYTMMIWDQLLNAAGPENNRATCAECVGRLAIITPQAFLPKMQELLQNRSQAARAIAVQALRYTLPDTSETFDTILRDHLVAMLNTALKDNDMEIRRLAMTALNSAAHNKPELILGNLGELLPYIMEESKAKPELIREVQMGPFKHLVDDGLEVRKGAYETLYALIETAFTRISITSLFDRVIAGLGDDHDIRAMCNLMLSRLAYIAPEETARQLPLISDKYRAILSTKLKDNAVKQEHEKQDDAHKSVLRATLLLAERLRVLLNDGGNTATIGGGSSGVSTNNKWLHYWEWVNKTYESQLRVLREENRELGNAALGNF